jgi:hypothetical protein
MVTTSERQLLVGLRRALLHLHKTLLDWERVAYDRAQGRRTPPAELLNVVMSDPQFAWLRPLSELIVRIDGALDMDAPDVAIDVDVIIGHARQLVAPEGDSAYARRYHTALQDHPDAVLAHGAVTTILKSAPRPHERLH